MCEPITSSFFGTQPRITQVPPMRYSSAIITRAPWPAAIRAARTPPEPPPMTNRSTSKSVTAASCEGSEILPLLLHLFMDTLHHVGRQLLGPRLHRHHELVEHAWLCVDVFLA